MFFEICTAINEPQTFATGTSIRELPRLNKVCIRHREEGIPKEVFPGLNMQRGQAKTECYAVCLKNAGYAASLEVRKRYPVLHDPQADAGGLIRVIDESGDDYLYPSRLFERVP